MKLKDTEINMIRLMNDVHAPSDSQKELPQVCLLNLGAVVLNQSISCVCVCLFI